MATGDQGHPSPWWERPQFCAESTIPECHTQFYTQLECHTEVGEDGRPVKRCERLHKRLLNCPGKPPVTDEEKQELTTYGDNPLAEAAGVDASSAAASQPHSADLGDALAEFLKLAEEMQERLYPAGAVQLDVCPQAAAAPPPCAQQQDAEQAQPEGVFGRLLRWQQLRRAAAAKQSSSGPSSRPWHDLGFDSKCEEV